MSETWGMVAGYWRIVNYFPLVTALSFERWTGFESEWRKLRDKKELVGE
jgi:hypothetical protein